MAQLQATDRVDKLWGLARWYLLAAAIGLQSLQICYIGNLHHGFFNPDKARQIAVARGLLDGYGLTSPVPNSADASTPVRYPLSQWPMGYSVLFAALWWLMGDLWNTAVAIEVLGAILFFTAWIAILEWQGKWINSRVKFLVMGYWAFVWNPLNVQTCTEMLSLGLLCWGVAFCLRAAADRHALASSMAAAFCVGLAAWFRYAYWPLVIVTPASLAIALLFSPNRRRMAAATALNAALAGGLLLGVIVLQRTCVGNLTCLTGIPERELTGVYWSNLLRVCPFPSAATGFNDIWPFAARHASWLKVLPELKLDWALSALVVMAVGAWGVRSLMRFRHAAAAPDVKATATDRALLATLVTAGVCTTAVTIVMLIYLSIRTPLDGDYTYVVERRYFAVFYPFLGVALACALVAFFERRGGRITAVAKSGIVAAIMAWVVLGAGWRVGRLVRHHCDVGAQQSTRLADCWECRVVGDTVRRHLDAGRNTLFIHPRGSEWFCSHGEKRDSILALMAGSPTASYDSAQVMRLPPGGSVTLLAVVPDADDPEASKAAEYIARHGDFKRLTRLRDGWLYESTWRAEHTAWNPTPCPPTR